MSSTWSEAVKQNVTRVVIGLVLAVILFNTSIGQTYSYCWNEGAPEPHHLGYVVNDDHLCSWREKLLKF